MRAAKIAQISTAPAAMSFTSPATDGSPGDTRFTRRSMAVLNASAASTIAKHRRMTSHSVRVISNRMPAMVTAMMAAQCIQALCSLLKNYIRLSSVCKAF